MKINRFFESTPTRFLNRKDRNAFYFKPISPIEDRIIPIQDLQKFDIPQEIVDKMKDWDVIF